MISYIQQQQISYVFFSVAMAEDALDFMGQLSASKILIYIHRSFKADLSFDVRPIPGSNIQSF